MTTKPYRRFQTAPQMAASLGVFILLTLLLESGGLNDWAQRLDLGPERRIAVPVAAALHRTLAHLHIEPIRTAALKRLAQLRWSDDPEALADATTTLSSQPESRSDAVERPAVGAAASLNPKPNAITTPTPLALTPLRPGDPPRLTALPTIPPIAPSATRTIALAGDSMMAVGLYSTLHRLAPTYPALHFLNAFKSGTGLARPEVFNWQAEYPAMLHDAHPDFVLVAIGANDGQGFVDSGITYPFGTDGWQQVYEARVQNYLDMLTANGATVVWIGLPPMKSGVYDAHIAAINRIFYSVVTASPHAIWFSTTGVLGDPDGRYRDFGEVDGHTAKLRQGDGIHMSDDGASLIAAKILPWLALQTPAPAPVPVAAPQPATPPIPPK